MRAFLLTLFAIGGTALAGSPACSPEKALVRKEWRELEYAERKDYIDAIWCLRDRPAILPNAEFPGVFDRWDDFVATHINYTNKIHFNGILLPWHRQFLFLWERTLREECGYKGSVPYWNWALDTENMFESPLFDDSETSLSGNGEYDPNEPIPCSPGKICLPRGTGGGCVQGGPFKDFVVHMGPISPTFVQSYGPIPDNAYDYNPHCLTRSLSPTVLQMLNNQTAVELMQEATSIQEWLEVMSPSEADRPGSHSGGHRGIGGAMGDFFASPQDPAFMLHHAFIDRLWAQWQDQDPVNRRNALNGTTVIYDPPDAPLVTLDTLVEFGQLSPARAVEKMMDPMENGYCYTYT
ncbi:hypothetical protein ABOM_005685 [Aspergillus bombycis]|uniref:Tyrosinase copper-binding domain-containing protein n=1 Tax=Aspergillus bombycis TaxID=109264 RepID=A0A1F8A303_9EURO|nr:hypothetical protein ABOM_005685 [Aspergillus bombycis]OGM46102.1 hypothetical protein ABOM_005685 [Aspergillus bombycis]